MRFAQPAIASASFSAMYVCTASSDAKVAAPLLYHLPRTCNRELAAGLVMCGNWFQTHGFSLACAQHSHVPPPYDSLYSWLHPYLFSPFAGCFIEVEVQVKFRVQVKFQVKVKFRIRIQVQVKVDIRVWARPLQSIYRLLEGHYPSCRNLNAHIRIGLVEYLSFKKLHSSSKLSTTPLTATTTNPSPGPNLNLNHQRNPNLYDPHLLRIRSSCRHMMGGLFIHCNWRITLLSTGPLGCGKTRACKQGPFPGGVLSLAGQP